MPIAKRNSGEPRASLLRAQTASETHSNGGKVPTGAKGQALVSEPLRASEGKPPKGGVSLPERMSRLSLLLKKIGPVPEEWEKEAQEAAKNPAKGGSMSCLPCTSYSMLVNSWRKAMKWNDNLDCALSVMLASVASTKMVGEQLWFKILGPPSSGKTTLVEGLAVNGQYTLSKSTFRGFHSGFKTPDGKDHSLLEVLRDKTFIIKDGDTLLKSPNLGQILAEGRDIYDRNSRTHYRNDKSNDYIGYRMTWLLCGTAALREIDDSELGARFLDCVVMEGIDDEFEDDVTWRAVNQEHANTNIESNGEADKQYAPALVEAMRLSGGYVEHLRNNAVNLVNKVQIDEPVLRRCGMLGKFIAIMRASPPKGKKIDEDASREFAPRLGKQILRLAKFLAVTMNKNSVDDEIIRRVTKITMDTSRGMSLELMDCLAKAPYGIEPRGLAIVIGKTENKLRDRLRFLRQLGAVELNEEPATNGSRQLIRKWLMSETMNRLYSYVKEIK